jgi:hypothetical protein
MDAPGAPEVLLALRRAGFSVRLEGPDRLRVVPLAAAGLPRLDDAQREAIRRHKGGLLAVLRREAAGGVACPAQHPPPAPRFPVGQLVVGTYAGISTPPRAVVGATYVVERGRWRYRLAGEDFSRAEGELRAVTTEAAAAPPAARPGGVP